MATKKSFLKNKKVLKKTIGHELGSSVAGLAAFEGSRALTNFAKTKITNEKIVKAIGPAKFLLGGAAHLLIDDSKTSGKYISKIGYALMIQGGDNMVDDFVPEETKTKMFLSGVGNTTKTKKEKNSTSDFDWEAAAAEAEAELKNGNSDDDEMAGVTAKREDAVMHVI